LVSSLCGAAAYAAPGGWLSPGEGSRASASLEDMVAKATAIREQVVSDLDHVQGLQRVARKEKDVIKLNCVNERLLEIKPLANLVEQRQGELPSAHADDQAAVFTEIQQSGDASRKAREAADQCIGQPVISASDSANSFTHPDGLNTTSDDPSSETILEAPAYASPYN
jgi:hypothetical protein